VGSRKADDVISVTHLVLKKTMVQYLQLVLVAKSLKPLGVDELDVAAVVTKVLLQPGECY
jgi:hypothetical protein